MKQHISIAIDAIIGFFLSLLALYWGIELLVGYLQGLPVRLTFAVSLLFVGTIGLAAYFYRTVFVTISDEGIITIYSHMGLKKDSYEVHRQLVSNEWDKANNRLMVSFSDGKAFRFSKNSFFNLHLISDRLKNSGI